MYANGKSNFDLTLNHTIYIELVWADITFHQI